MQRKRKRFSAFKFFLIVLIILAIGAGFTYKSMGITKHDKFIFKSEKEIENFVFIKKDNPRINVDDIEEYGNKAIYAICLIQNCIEEHKDKTDDTVKIYINTLIPIEQLEQIQSYFLIYYGFSDVQDAVSYKIGNYLNYMVLVVDMGKINKAEKIKEQVDKEVRLMADTIGSELSDKEKIKTVADIVAATIEYTEGYRDTYSAIKEHKGVCNSYAMLMKNICDRLYLHSDICFGWTDEESKKENKAYHAWNRIRCTNGRYVYADLTAYDTSKSEEDIYMSETPYKAVGVNTYIFDEDIQYPEKLKKIS